MALVIDPNHPNTRIEVAADGQMVFFDSVQQMGVTLSDILMGGPAPEPKTLEMGATNIGTGLQHVNNIYYVNHGYQNRWGVAPKIVVQCFSRLTGKSLTEGRSGDKLVSIQEVDGNQFAVTFSSKLGVNEVQVRYVLDQIATNP
jgi:hypothetical protein